MKISQTYKNIFVLVAVAGSFFLITRTLAVSNPFRPGETRDPACAPGDPFCTVTLEKDLYRENAIGVITNITSGINSIAIGSGVTASGNYSVAIGHEDVNTGEPGPSAGGDYSVAIGSAADARGQFSVAVGGGYSEGESSFAAVLGNSVGLSSVAIGIGTYAPSFGEISLGLYPEIYTPESATSWSSEDRIFSVGFGENGAKRANALTILKNGNVGILNSKPGFSLTVGGRDGIKIPSGEELERPIMATEGVMRFNTDSSLLEYYDGEDWISVGGSGGGQSLNYVRELSVGKVPANVPTTNGEYSIGVGIGTIANSYGEISAGIFPLNHTATGNDSFNLEDILFSIGNGNFLARKNALTINKRGTVGIGNISKAQLLTMESNDIFLGTDTGAYLTTTGTWVDASDQSLKTNIRNLNYGLNEVRMLQPRSFDFIKNGKSSIGLIAQEVETIIPEVVSMGIDTKGIEYGQLNAVLINAIKELDARVAQLESNNGYNYQPSPQPQTNNEPTPEQNQEASLIRSTNEMNLTNALLLLVAGLLLVNLMLVIKRSRN